MTAELDLSAKLEAILFWKGEPVTVARLAEWAQAETAEVIGGLQELEQRLTGRGVQLVFTGSELNADTEILLGTASSAGSLIEKLTKEELMTDLGKAGLETLAIILYQGPVSRKDIEYIRGVNCSYIIRNLLIRGLVEKTDLTKSRGASYAPTVALLSYLGVGRISDLPEFSDVQREIQKAGEEAEHS